MPEDLTQRITENPFYVLGLGRDCSRHEFEREGQKLLSMLALGLSEAARYLTPFGPRPRTPELVRRAMAELRDPKRRLVHELLAALPPTSVAPPRIGADHEQWGAAPAVFGYGPRGQRER